ncbi:unnamed protein product, partial [Urochloa humidicola]
VEASKPVKPGQKKEGGGGGGGDAARWRRSTPRGGGCTGGREGAGAAGGSSPRIHAPELDDEECSLDSTSLNRFPPNRLLARVDVVDPLRCSLSTNTVEALICFQSWLHSSQGKVSTREAAEEVQLYEDIIED